MKVKTQKLFSKVNLAIFAVIFAGLGTYIIINSFAATPTGLNTAAADIFISATGSDTGSNCKRYTSPQSTPPAASTVCATAARAYELMSNGDTAWILPGAYGGGHAWDFEVNTPSSFKASVGSDCNATKSCFYFIPQPGQEVNVTGGSPTTNDDNYPGFKPNKAPDNLYYANFVGPRMCPSFSSTADSTTGFHQDITVANFKGTDCTPYIYGPWSNIRIIGADIAYDCNTEGLAGGWQIQSNQSGKGGETDNHIYAPHDLLISGNKIHDFTINGCGPTNPHEDCIHVYAWYNATVENNTFDNCYDSSILVGGLDEPGFNENVIIQNNWFGPTQLGTNNCCLRGADNSSLSATETFDGYIIRFNTSTSTFMNKANSVLNNVSFIGNIGLGDNVCASGSGVVWKYNIYKTPSSKCDSSDTTNANNTTLKFVNINNGTLDLHLQTGSLADGYVPVSQANGCSAVSGGKDKFGNLRATTGSCDAGAHELGGVTPPSGQTANLWVSTTGSNTVNGTGNCQRNANPAQYDPNRDCTMAAAYQAALPGDSVIVKGGTYTSEVTFANNSNAATPNIVFDEAVNENAVFNGGFSVGGYDNNAGASYVTFKNFTFTNASNPSNANSSIVGIENATKVIFDGVLIEGSPNCANPSWVGSGFKMYGDNNGIELRNSEVRCVRNGKLISSEVTGGSTKANVNTIIYNTKIHTMWRDTTDDHNECFFAPGSPGLTIERSIFYDCTVMDINSGCFGSSCVSWGYNYNWTIRNSVFEAPVDLGPGDPSGNGWLDGCSGTNPFAGHKWEYNLFGANWSTNNCANLSGMVLTGNIGRIANSGSCPAGPTYSANIFYGVNCAGVTQNDGILASGNFANSGAHDWSPVSAAAPQVNAGSLSSFPPLDIFGNSRYSGSAPDAGPYEFQSGNSIPKPGNTDNDSDVDATDLNNLLSHYKSTTYTNADFNNDGIVNARDLSVLLSNFGQ